MVPNNQILTSFILFFQTSKKSNPFNLLRLHFPFTLALTDMWEKDKLVDAIKKMKDQLD